MNSDTASESNVIISVPRSLKGAILFMCFAGGDTKSLDFDGSRIPDLKTD